MKFTLMYAKGPWKAPEGGWPTVEINSLQELEELDKKEGSHSLIIDFGANPRIIIYNGYVE